VGSTIAKDSTVTVLSSGASLSLRVDTSGKNGHTHKITVNLA
jgi:hypothetical protein